MDFKFMNSAHLEKQAWRAIQKPQMLWVPILKSLYHATIEFVHAKRMWGDSWVWANLLHGSDVIMQGARWGIGNGNDINIERDKWVAVGVMISKSGNAQTTKEGALINVNTSSWDMGKIRALFDLIDAIRIIQTPLRWTRVKDVLVWPFTNNGMYTI